MKLVFIYHDRPDYFSGPIVNARRLLPALAARGHEVHCLLLFTGSAAGSAAFLKSKGIRCHLRRFHIPTEHQIAWILSTLKTIRPDVFVPNLNIAGCYAARWIRQAGIPTVGVHRSDDDFYWALSEEFVSGSPEFALSGMVCVSQAIHDRIARTQPMHTQLSVIPSGVPIPSFTSLQSGPLLLVYCGRLVQSQKRIMELVEALCTVVRRHPHIEATLIGNGPGRHAIASRIADSGLGARIRLQGTVPSEHIQETLARHHVLILLSDYEGTPGAVMDGMAAGLVPVCLDREGGVRELVIHGHTGLLVQDRQDDFLRAIARLQAHPELRRTLARNARDMIVAKYSLEQCVDRWEDFLGQLLRTANPRSEITIPKQFMLPPTRDGFAHEDKRVLTPAKESLFWRLFRRSFG